MTLLSDILAIAAAAVLMFGLYLLHPAFIVLALAVALALLAYAVNEVAAEKAKEPRP